MDIWVYIHAIPISYIYIYDILCNIYIYISNAVSIFEAHLADIRGPLESLGGAPMPPCCHFGVTPQGEVVQQWMTRQHRHAHLARSQAETRPTCWF